MRAERNGNVEVVWRRCLLGRPRAAQGLRYNNTIEYR
jgi:hypothetical protein